MNTELHPISQIQLIDPSVLSQDEKERMAKNMAEFFRKEVLSLLERFPSFGQAFIAEYVENHSPNELEKKLGEEGRFFRILQDDQGDIIGYFESKRHEREYGGDYEVAQWLLMDEKFRRHGLSKKLWESFFEGVDTYLEEKGLSHIDIVSQCKRNNKESIAMHLSLGFNRISINGESDDHIWKLTRRREK